MNLSEGHIIAEHYKLVKQLGHGSFGDVWLAHNMLADIDVAIKFYGTFDQKGLEGFRNEFKIAYKLNHPNLLSINHFDVYENCPYLVMPYCANGSASKFIGNISEPELWKFIYDVSSGLAFLHEQQPPIVHQDIKPDNILITAEGRYVISDFGISRSFRTMMSRTNNLSSGTLAYMGPERFSEQPMMVLASDIWALGMTLFELMTGDVLWGGTGGCVQLNGARIPANDGRWSQQLYQLVCSSLSLETWERPTAVQLSQIAACHLSGKPESMTVLVLPQPAQLSPQPAPPSPQSQDTVAPRTYSPSHDYTTKPSQPTNYYSATGKDNGHKNTDSYKEDFSLKYFIYFAIACLAVFLIIMGIIFWNDDDKSPVTTTPPATEVQSTPAALQQPAAPAVPEVSTPTGVKETILPRVKAKTTKKKKESVQAASKRIEQTQSFSGTQPVYVQRPSNGNTEDDKAFRNCKTPADYNLYLSKYPNGKHRSEAQNAIKAVNREYERINSRLPADKRRQHKSLNPR